MNERQWWSSHIKPAWHKPHKRWLAWKVQDEFFGGMPDSICQANGAVALIEVKYEAKIPALNTTRMFVEQSVKPKGKGLSVKQRNRLQEWEDAGGLSWVFYGVEKDGFLLWLGDCVKEGMTRQYLYNHAMIICAGYKQFSNVMEHLDSYRQQ